MPAPRGVPHIRVRPGDGVVYIDWNRVPRATGYRVRYGPQPGALTTTIDVVGTNAEIIWPNGQPVFFTVCAYNADGEGPITPEQSATPVAPPATPAATPAWNSWVSIIRVAIIIVLATVVFLLVFPTVLKWVASDKVICEVDPDGFRLVVPRTPGKFTRDKVDQLTNTTCSLAVGQAKHQQTLESNQQQNELQIKILEFQLAQQTNKMLDSIRAKNVELKTENARLNAKVVALNAKVAAAEKLAAAEVLSSVEPAPTFLVGVENRSQYPIVVTANRVGGKWPLRSGESELLEIEGSGPVTFTATYFTSLGRCGKKLGTCEKTVSSEALTNGKKVNSRAGLVDARVCFDWQ